ncbi:MAG: GNAT family N-acetyltransferase [Syntrophomonas sp.]
MFLSVERYDHKQKNTWDDFVRRSKNGTFLLLRNYMDYHQDRFQDHSLLIRDMQGRVRALLPANQNDCCLSSHGGLTYGGFISDTAMTTPEMLEIFKKSLSYMQENYFKRFIYKTIPSIYHKAPAEEDRYALFLCDARLYRRDVLTVVDKNCRLSFQNRRRRGIARAKKNDLYIKLYDDFALYWDILTENLQKRHQVKPVHSLVEIQILHDYFPENIKLFCCCRGSAVLAGVVIYESEKVAHAQYISADEKGRELGALDLLFDYLLNDYYIEKGIFDFGNSNEENGYKLNKGLIEQKEGFGGRTVVHDYYEIGLARGEVEHRLMGAML